MTTMEKNSFELQQMEHVTIINVRNDLLKLTADDGFMLLNKNSRKLHKWVTTKNPNRFEVMPVSSETQETE